MAAFRGGDPRHCYAGLWTGSGFGTTASSSIRGPDRGLGRGDCDRSRHGSCPYRSWLRCSSKTTHRIQHYRHYHLCSFLGRILANGPPPMRRQPTPSTLSPPSRPDQGLHQWPRLRWCRWHCHRPCPTQLLQLQLQLQQHWEAE